MSRSKKTTRDPRIPPVGSAMSRINDSRMALAGRLLALGLGEEALQPLDNGIKETWRRIDQQLASLPPR